MFPNCTSDIVMPYFICTLGEKCFHKHCVNKIITSYKSFQQMNTYEILVLQCNKPLLNIIRLKSEHISLLITKDISQAFFVLESKN